MLSLHSKLDIILCYHDLYEQPTWFTSSQYSTSVDVFRQNIETLSKYFNFVSLEEMVVKPSSRRRIALTFDDGFKSVYTFAHSFLKSKGMPYAMFVCADALQYGMLRTLAPILKRRMPALATQLEANGVDETMVRLLNTAGLETDEIFLNASEIRQMLQEGVTIGNHSKSHFPLAALTLDRLRADIHYSKEFLEKEIGIRPKHFGLPYGKKEHYSDTVMAEVEAAGYEYAYITNPVPVRKERFRSSRNGINVVPRIGAISENVNELLFYFFRPTFRKIDI